MDNEHSGQMRKYVSPVGAWALSFGAAVGWGAFVMPGTTFLPVAGPLGTAIGMLLGVFIMLIIGKSYAYLMRRFPESGGAFSFVKNIMGSDHGFLCAWLLILTYISIIWANATALSLIIRFIFGDAFCFGFSYTVAGYTVYFGEVILSVVAILVAAAVCVLGGRIAKWVQIVFASLLILGVVAAFIGVVAKSGVPFSGPAFSSAGSPAVQVFSIIILAPWAFIGFESISHSAAEFSFSPKKSMPVMIVALATGVIAYVLLTFIASVSAPDGFADWSEYIASLGSLSGLDGLPTFFNARHAMGTLGVAFLALAALGGIVTGLVAHLTALSRLVFSMAQDELIPAWFAKLGKRGTPVNTICVLAAVSALIPLLGRTAIGWIVDVTTVGAIFVYSYTSFGALYVARREKNVRATLFSSVGAVLSLALALYYLIPNFWSSTGLANESYLIFAVWGLLGIIVFRVMIGKDRTRRLGKSEVVWFALLLLIVVISMIWIRQAAVSETSAIIGDVEQFRATHASEELQNSAPFAETGKYISQRIQMLDNEIMGNVLILMLLILASVGVIFSVFSIIKKREKEIESERILAEERSLAKSTFLSNMSHDIRTPMNAITGYTELALREEMPDGVREYLSKIEYSSKHLLSLINDILDMSRIESGKVELDFTPSDVAEEFKGTCDLFSEQMREKGLVYRVDCECEHSAVLMDKARAARVLLNLISNALKFTPAGGTVSASLSETAHDEKTVTLKIVVQDTGIGMSPEFAARVFEAFEREENMVSKIQGTGLGMAITKSLTELMGGEISVQTEKGSGTAFTIVITLDRCDPSEIRSADDVRASIADHAGLSVLVAEDNPVNSEIAKLILEQSGFVVDLAENGRIAVSKIVSAPEDKYDLVLMDIQMPEMNGLEATKAIRALQGARSRVPIIAMSANAFTEDVKRSIDAGMNAHISKPIQIEVMMKTISEVLDKK